MLERGASGAAELLENVIRPEMARWLVDDHPTSTPLDMSKTDVLGLVDALLQRLGN